MRPLFAKLLRNEPTLRSWLAQLFRLWLTAFIPLRVFAATLLLVGSLA